MDKLKKIGWMVIVGLGLLASLMLEASHQRGIRDMKIHEDERTWRAVDSVLTTPTRADSIIIANQDTIKAKLDSLLHFGFLAASAVAFLGWA